MTTPKTKARRKSRSKDIALPADVIVLEATARKAKNLYERCLVLQRRAKAVQQIRASFRVLEGGLAA